MATTLAQTVAFSQAFIQGLPLTAWGAGGEPALTIANQVQSFLTTPPLSWNWNRFIDESITTIVGQQDYTADLYQFGYLEKASLTDSIGRIWEIPTVKNNQPIAKSTQQARPDVICALIDNTQSGVPSTYVTIRFSAIPDQVYSVDIIYQMSVENFTSVNQDWALPDNCTNIFTNMFLGEAMAMADDPRSQIYRQRGVAALLSRQSGLSDTDKALFAEAYIREGVNANLAQLRTQQYIQSRGV